MERYTPEISDSIFWVGSKDWNRRMFDALIPLPDGTSYNAYLIKGSRGTALIDSVNPGFEGELLDKLRSLTDAEVLDYVIMNHAEPDHANAIKAVMDVSSEAKLVTTRKGARMAQVFYKIPEQRLVIVKDGDTLELGGRTLHFIEAPWLHWPETMFTYVEENKVLFPCDYFGAHTAAGFYDDEVENLIPVAKRYFGEIMMPFKGKGAQALERISGLDICMIAPSHGPIYRNPERILDMYRIWTAGETQEKAILVYASMWGATEKMIKAMAETLMSEGIQISYFNLLNSDIGDIARELVDSRAIVLGTPTVLGEMHPLAVYATHLVKILKPPLRYGAALSSYGWGGGAVRQLSEMLKPTKIEVVGAIEINGPASDEDFANIASLGKELAAKIRSSG
ncbi:FprA family A-type flavoprotein [Methanolobus chelungpuianus]|uniref:Metallo-beta-lactamase n=1 Tax=Methanolobus chelungpuianus TaxID=502115 RepID=A0AAE3HBC8_9EURY|nr:FprA family A-type flavoprotein [Methanolobus chelungpuianus]MCQ6963024.1 metallo-beta-lactamase [Methanolobus chelungpuianus]